jgi:hypothetical protein
LAFVGENLNPDNMAIAVITPKAEDSA